MDYNLAKIVPGEISYTLDHAMPYGQMPDSLLTSKFEETDMGPDDDIYDDYARGQLSNWGPDTNKFEYEEPRGGVNRSAGRIQLQYYGHRGNADDPAHPEMFLGFGGPEDRDPRGINVDPDMKQMRKQHEARMRFTRWDPDGCDHITGGGRSEGQTMADQQKLFRVVRDRLKVFDRQIDGRRNGMRRDYKHKSGVPKQVLVQSYGDFIRDYALNPQKRANIICKHILRDSTAWREETSDQDFTVAKYTQCRRRGTRGGHNRVISARRGQDTILADGDSTRNFKAAGILMSHIVRSKRQGVELARGSDMDFAETQQTIIRKTAPLVRDLGLILRAMSQDSSFGPNSGDTTMISKTAAPMVLEHLARVTACGHLTPAHHYLNAEIICKSVKPGADLRKIKDKIITDARAEGLREVHIVAGKSAKMRMRAGKLNVANDTAAGEGDYTFNYRTKVPHRAPGKRSMISGEDYKSESDMSQNRQVNHQGYRGPAADDSVTGINFLDNSSKERHSRGLGSKYMMRHMARDERGDEISAAN